MSVKETKMRAFDYLEDAQDRVIAETVPTLVAPTHGSLPELGVGRHRYVVGAQGLYLQARHHGLSVCARLHAEPVTTPYGALPNEIALAGGGIPEALYEDMVGRARAACPNEWAGAVLWDDGAYRLIEPRVLSVSGSHVAFETRELDPEGVVLNIHSHGASPAWFSRTDDHADSQGGIYIASILGELDGPPGTETACSRLVVNGIFLPLPWHPWACG
jgi:PRTRC genetic system protein A